MSEAPFLEIIRENPNDDTARLIFADWLEERGDPRGEFIRVQCELAKLPEGDERRPALISRELQLLQQYSKHWAWPLRKWVKRWTFHRGLIEEISELRTHAFVQHVEEIFQLAPLRFVGLNETDQYVPEVAAHSELQQRPGPPLPEGFIYYYPWQQEVLGTWSLGTGLNSEHDKGLKALRTRLQQSHFQHLGLQASNSMQHLREWAVSSERGTWHMLDLSNCALNANEVRLLADSRTLSRLVYLVLRNNRVGPEGATALASAADLKQLQRLDLSNSFIQDEGVRALARGTGLPQLAALDLRRNQITSRGAQYLAEWPLSNRLYWLDLQHNQLGDAGATALLKAEWPRLAWLNLRENGLSAAIKSQLRQRFGYVVRY